MNGVTSFRWFIFSEIREEKIISEALVMIPFLDNPNPPTNVAETIRVGDKNVFREFSKHSRTFLFSRHS